MPGNTCLLPGRPGLINGHIDYQLGHPALALIVWWGWRFREDGKSWFAMRDPLTGQVEHLPDFDGKVTSLPDVPDQR